MKIAIDAMGGDNAPAAIIKGVKLFLRNHSDVEFILVGQKDVIEKEMESQSLSRHPLISIQMASEVIEMSETPVKALRNKKDASISVMMDLAKEEKVDAVLSAGNTGAMVAAATLKLRTLNGIDRPAIATVMPTPYGRNIFLDVGAVTDCKVKNYLQFGIMGSCMAQLILDISNPSVGLLNVGEEDAKGNDITKEAFNQLKIQSNINFYGNIEGSDIFKDTVNVIITDGFVGNIVLKACESLAKGLFSVIKTRLYDSFTTRLGGMLIKKAFKEVIEEFNHEKYGGALLLGVNGVVLISHGSSSPVAFQNAIKSVKKMVESKLNQKINEKMEKINE